MFSHGDSLEAPISFLKRERKLFRCQFEDIENEKRGSKEVI